MNKKIKILSIAQCLVKQNNNWINNEYVFNRHKTIEQSNLFDLTIFDTSQISIEFESSKLENNLLNILKNYYFDVIHIEINKPLHSNTYKNTFGLNFLKYIKNKYSSKLIFLWGDCQIPLFKVNIDKLSNISDLNIITSSFFLKSFNQKKNIYLYDPIENSFIYDKDKKEIDVLYIGQFKPERINFLFALESHLKNKKNCNYLFSSKTKNFIDYKKYYELYRKSKIIINFSRTIFNLSVLNGRALQTTMSNSLFLEQISDITPYYFIPYKEYIPFRSPQDLIKKIDYFLINEEERKKISYNAYNKSINFYNSRNYWKNILYKLYPDIILDKINTENDYQYKSVSYYRSCANFKLIDIFFIIKIKIWSFFIRIIYSILERKYPE